MHEGFWMGWNLIGDIGGTNMRLAVEENGSIVDQQTLPTVGETGIEQAIADIVKAMGSNPAGAAIAAAGIVEQARVVLTNTGTVITEAAINLACGISNARILNDFEAAAWSLANINDADISCLQGERKLVEKPRVILGPGTGLGVGALVYRGSEPVVVQGEGGHVRLSPGSSEELEIFMALGETWPQVKMGSGHAVEAEAVLSGTGLPKFYKAISNVMGVHSDPKNTGEIFRSARSRDDALAVKAIDYFTQYLGEIAGDMGVTFAAKGGVFLTGGVLTANPWIFETPLFLDAFNSGGRHSYYRRSLPVFVYSNPHFGLNGAINYLRFNS